MAELDIINLIHQYANKMDILLTKCTDFKSSDEQSYLNDLFIIFSKLFNLSQDKLDYLLYILCNKFDSVNESDIKRYKEQYHILEPTYQKYISLIVSIRLPIKRIIIIWQYMIWLKFINNIPLEYCIDSNIYNEKFYDNHRIYKIFENNQKLVYYIDCYCSMYGCRNYYTYDNPLIESDYTMDTIKKDISKDYLNKLGCTCNARCKYCIRCNSISNKKIFAQLKNGYTNTLIDVLTMYNEKSYQQLYVWYDNLISFLNYSHTYKQIDICLCILMRLRKLTKNDILSDLQLCKSQLNITLEDIINSSIIIKKYKDISNTHSSIFVRALALWKINTYKQQQSIINKDNIFPRYYMPKNTSCGIWVKHSFYLQYANNEKLYVLVCKCKNDIPVIYRCKMDINNNQFLDLYVNYHTGEKINNYEDNDNLYDISVVLEKYNMSNIKYIKRRNSEDDDKINKRYRNDYEDMDF